MSTTQLTLGYGKVVQLPEFINCLYHDDWNWKCFYSDGEAEQMLDEQDALDCPYCLAEIVGIEL